MNKGYFHRVAAGTPTRLWINNPTLEEVDKAIASGAISCTTNPAYASRMLKEEREWVLHCVDNAINQTGDDNEAADIVQQNLVSRVMGKFLPLYQSSPGLVGFVSIQGNPHADDNSGYIIKEAMRYQRLGTNFIAKIPATKAGLEAMEYLLAMGIPVIATEVFAISQAIYTCELYGRISKKSGKTPPFYLTHITGILDEYLAGVVGRDGIEISPEVLRQAGCAVAREQYRIFKERGYAGTMLGGGARDTYHFTEMVGGDIHITINWKTAKEIIEANPPVVSRMEVQASRRVVDELCGKIPDFRRAFVPGALGSEEFHGYGPVQHFRNNFINGWNNLLETIKGRRANNAMGVTPKIMDQRKTIKSGERI
jgi:transaldolase